MIFDGKAGLPGGIALIVVATCLCIVALGEARKQAYAESHSPVMATIASKTEIRVGRGGTRVGIDYWRDTASGPVHCAVTTGVPGRSSNYEIGKTLSIFPREGTCYEPYVIFPGERSAIGLFLLAIPFVLVGGLMIRYRKSSTLLARLQWRRIPDTISDKMMQLVIVARCQPRRHRLDALAIARSNQSRNVQRTHPPPRFVT